MRTFILGVLFVCTILAMFLGMLILPWSTFHVTRSSEYVTLTVRMPRLFVTRETAFASGPQKMRPDCSKAKGNGKERKEKPGLTGWADPDTAITALHESENGIIYQQLLSSSAPEYNW